MTALFLGLLNFLGVVSVFCWFQVADILPTRSQADIMQRELESCLSLEYTPDSLPLLLHQVGTKRQKIYALNKKQKRMILNFFEKFLNLHQFPFCIFFSSQFFTDRSYHLAQIRYLLMLRWRRFCRHASVIEKLYPHYKVAMCKRTA